MNQPEVQSPIDRDALVSALSRMDHFYWRVLKRQSREIERHIADGDAADDLSRKSTDAGEESQAAMWRDAADRHHKTAATYQRSVNKAWQRYHVADAGIRELMPVLLGELPVVDLMLLEAADPVELGQQIRKLPGKVLAELGNTEPNLTHRNNREASDTKSDTEQKAKKKRSLTEDARKVANEIKRRKKRNDFESLEIDVDIICKDLHIGSKPSTIKRNLNDHPSAWKDA